MKTRMSPVGKAERNKARREGGVRAPEKGKGSPNPVPKARSGAGKRLGESGYAYVMVLAAVVILSILAATAAILTSYQVRHDKEEELLFRGYAYEKAIQNYYLARQPGIPPAYPRRLQDLLSDPRFVHQRYLRALYPDPLGAGWELVQAPDGGIAGVATKSREKPLKQDDFPSVFSGFAGAQHYSDWVFFYQPGSTAIPAQPGTGASPGNSGF